MHCLQNLIHLVAKREKVTAHNDLIRMSNHSNINLRSGPILAVLIHSLLHALPAGMLFTKPNKNIALSRVIGTYPFFTDHYLRQNSF